MGTYLRRRNVNPSGIRLRRQSSFARRDSARSLPAHRTTVSRRAALVSPV
jgi:hypothetical protein